MGADLRPLAIAASAAKGNVTLRDAVRNYGTQPAGPFGVGFYFSSDNVFGGGDTFICSRPVSGLAAGTSNPASGTITTICPIPAMAPGLYYVIVVDDYLNAVPETNEGNNTRSTTTRLTIGPDLRPTAVAAYSSGSNLVLRDQARNYGTVNAGAFTIGFYLSTNNVYDGGDTEICTRSVSGLLAGTSNPLSGTQTTTCAIPAVAPGFYYVIVVDDTANTVAETIETNNTRSTLGTVKIGPDLVPTAVSPSKSGSNLILRDQARNAGNVAAGPFEVGFYLSLNTALDGGDVFVCTRAIAGLDAGKTNPLSGVATITCATPSGLPSGAYYVIAKDDNGNTVAEHTETNNNRASIGTLLLP